jgi:hypothetical protein
VRDLKQNISRIRDELGGPQPANTSSDGAHLVPVAFTQAPAAIRDGDVSNLYGLKERAIAADSLVFLLEVLQLMRPKLTELVPHNQHSTLRSFFNRSTAAVEQLQLYMHRSTMPMLLVELDKLPRSIEASKWELRKVRDTPHA